MHTQMLFPYSSLPEVLAGAGECRSLQGDHSLGRAVCLPLVEFYRIVRQYHPHSLPGAQHRALRERETEIQRERVRGRNTQTCGRIERLRVRKKWKD